MQWARVFGVALIALLAISISLSTTFASSGDGTTPASAIPFAGNASDTLGGSSAGAFVYYALAYPGDQSPVQLIMQVTPQLSPVAANGIGFTVYGPNKGTVYARSVLVDGNADLTANFSSSAPGTYLIQVYNYLPGVRISFKLSSLATPFTPAHSSFSSSAAATPTPYQPCVDRFNALCEITPRPCVSLLWGCRPPPTATITVRRTPVDVCTEPCHEASPVTPITTVVQRL